MNWWAKVKNDISRKDFLKKSSFTLLTISAVSSLNSCALLPVFYGKDHHPIIDVHAHIFNSRDQEQLKVMLYVLLGKASDINIQVNNKTLANWLAKFLFGVGKALIFILERTLEVITPSYTKENKMLEKKLKVYSSYNHEITLSYLINTESDLSEDETKALITIETDHEADDDDFLDALNKAESHLIKQIENTEDTSLLENFKKINDYIIYRKQKRAFKNNKSLNISQMDVLENEIQEDYNLWDEIIPDSEFDEAYPNDSNKILGINEIKGLGSSIKEAFDLVEKAFKYKSYIEFLMAPLRSHLGNVIKLSNLFEDTNWFRTNEKGTDHFVTSSVDMDFWTNSDQSGSKMNHSLIEQYALIEKTTLISEGKILPAVAFDPWREYAYQKAKKDPNMSPLNLLKKMILNHGFIAVKLYPSMGFKPFGNNNREEKFPDHAPKDDKFGEELDNYLIELYKFCCKYDVAIITHANPSMYTNILYKNYASAKAWEQVLSLKVYKDESVDFSEMRLNLGHSGGLEGIGKFNNWFKDILSVIRKYPNVYADLSNFDDIHTSSKRERFIKTLKSLKNDTKVLDRLMYGSDWYMLASYDRKHQYLNYMMKSINNLPEDKAANIMGLNALRFLGLSSIEDKNMQRTLEFYEKHKISPNFKFKTV